MIKLGQIFPEFKVKAAFKDDFIDIDNKTFTGKWLVFFFWPKDFTFVCPTEIVEFSNANGKFLERNAQILGASIDSEYVHNAWCEHNPMLKKIAFPMLADVRRDLVTKLGIMDETEGVAQRAVFIVDPENTIRFLMVTDMKVGRNVAEVLRVLDALQTDELCPCNWHPGEKTL